MSRSFNTIALADNSARDCFAEPAGDLPKQGPFSIMARQSGDAAFALALLTQEARRADGSFPSGSNKLSHRDTQQTNEATGYDGYSSGYQDSGPLPWNLEPGQNLQLDIDLAGNVAATFDATAPSVLGGGGPYNLDGAGANVIEITVTGPDLPESGVLQSYSLVDADSSGLTLSDITDAELVTVINREFVGVHAQLSGGKVQITCDGAGTGFSLLVGSAAFIAVVGFAAAVQTGTGDVANINAVTAAEAKAVIEADTLAEVTILSSGAIRVASPTSGAGSTLEVDGASTIPASVSGFTEDSVAGTGTGSAATTEFSGQTLNNLPVVPFSVRVHGPGSAQVHYDKFGDGRLFIENTADPDAEVASGTINYATGAIDFTYTVVPPAGEILCDYISSQKVGIAGQSGHALAYHVEPIGANRRLSVWAVGLAGAARCDIEIVNHADGFAIGRV